MCGLKRLPPELAERCSLADLNLRLNQLLGGRGDSSSADFAAKWAALEQLTSLTRLDASECKLQVVPAAFAALSALQVLSLAGNPSLGRCGWAGGKKKKGVTTVKEPSAMLSCLAYAVQGYTVM